MVQIFHVSALCGRKSGITKILAETNLEMLKDSVLIGATIAKYSSLKQFSKNITIFFFIISGLIKI